MSHLTDEYLRTLQAELEARGWQPDKHGDADCADEACAAGADAVKELLALRAEVAEIKTRIGLLVSGLEGLAERPNGYHDCSDYERGYGDAWAAKANMARVVLNNSLPHHQESVK